MRNRTAYGQNLLRIINVHGPTVVFVSAHVRRAKRLVLEQLSEYTMSFKEDKEEEDSSYLRSVRVASRRGKRLPTIERSAFDNQAAYTGSTHETGRLS